MSEAKVKRRHVQANLIEATPSLGGLGHWLLASPLLLFLAWNWIALFDALSPTGVPMLDNLVGGLALIIIIVLPLGYGAHRLVTTLPRLFQNAGWDVQPLEPVRTAEQYLVHYDVQERQRAVTTWNRVWLRVAQGWVYLEIVAIFVGAIAMIPLFFSALQFGFGQ